jgi:hypothetical protein
LTSCALFLQVRELSYGQAQLCKTLSHEAEQQQGDAPALQQVRAPPAHRRWPSQLVLRAHIIGSQWVQTPRHGDPIASIAQVWMVHA